jgi:hypothetical protein
MKKFYLILAAAAGITFTSCTSNEYLGELDPNGGIVEEGSIRFGLSMPGTTRADIGGAEAARLLGNNFYVTGTKGTEDTYYPSPTLVFDHYLVHFGINTANTTESNTANWEYVGVTPGTAPYANYANLANTAQAQTIKYWDYSAAQYDFLAFSTGTYKAVKDKTNPADDEIGVTTMKYGSALSVETSTPTAYTFYLPSVAALRNVFISDITEVKKAAYGNDVTLKFKNLGSKIRVAFYETVPGYSVKDVKFYQVDGTTDFSGTKNTTATLISSAGLPIKGTVAVSFPYIGTDNESAVAYDKATATVSPAASSGTEAYQTYGTLSNFVGKESYEAASTIYLGRDLPHATFAGDEDNDYYTTVFPVSTSAPLTLRVDYTLVSTDGSGETINVYGAKAVVPSSYTVWQPNYAYTYIFKISDNTNGWTDDAATKAGLFPITFDAVVAQATDADAEQTTVTTVATPSITTYQQGHKYTTNEYSKTTKGKDNVVRKLYVQVMHNEGSPEAHPVGSTYASCPHPILSSSTAFLYKVSDADATEAEVMDALEKRTTAIDADDVTGRNGITLTKNSNMTYVTTIVNGPDDNPITIESGHGNAAEIDIANVGVTTGTYAFVYDYTDAAKTAVNEYQPIDVTGGTVGTSGTTYYSITTTDLNGVSATTAANEAVNNAYIYFSKTTTDGGVTYTYSYISVVGKTTLPAGLIKVAKSTIEANTVSGGSASAANTFYFDKYISNNGKYAVKVIKIVA